MSNGIDIRQNEDRSIAMLAAQRQLYRDVKTGNLLIASFSVIIPFGLSLLVELFKNVQGLLIASSLLSIASLILSITIDNLAIQKKKLASFIQQKFDVYVYQMPWDKRLFGLDRNVDSEVAKYSKKILSNDKEKIELLDWYTLPCTQKPILEGILACQRENFSWDYELRNRARNWCIGIAFFSIVVIFAIGILNNELVVTLLFRLAFIAPILCWSIKLINTLNLDMNRLIRLKELINNAEKMSMEDLQIIQRELYDHRRNCFEIPDIVYKRNKDQDENREKRAAQF